MQRSDDSARNLRGVWLGPENAFRWPFDATFTEWGVGVALFWPVFVALWLVLPLGVLAVAGSWLGARWIARWASFGFGSQVVRRRTWLGFALVFCAALAPSPRTWLLPMTWWLAAPTAVLVSAWLVRAARPYLDGNRPVSYWLSVLRDIASGPRPLRPVLEITPEGFMIIDGHDNDLGDDLWTFMLTVNNADPEEVPVRRYRKISPEVEAVVWDIASGDERTGSDVIAWLRRKGLDVVVTSVEYRAFDNGVRYPVAADVYIQGALLPQKGVIYLDRLNPQIWSVTSAAEFGADFEEVPIALPSQ